MTGNSASYADWIGGGNVEIRIEGVVIDLPADRQAVIARARKIRSLAMRPGTEDEGRSAKAMLDGLVAKYGLTEQELADQPATGVRIVMRGPRSGGWAQVFKTAPETGDSPREWDAEKRRRK